MMSNIKENLLESVEVKVKSEVNLDNTFLPKNEHPEDDSIGSIANDNSFVIVKKEYEYIDNDDELNTDTLKQFNVSYINFKCKEEIKDEGQPKICNKFQTDDQHYVKEFSENNETDEKIDISQIILQSSEDIDNELKTERENDTENQMAEIQRNSSEDDTLKQTNTEKHRSTRRRNKKVNMINCQFCNKPFKYKSSLDYHLLHLHKNKIDSTVKQFITNKIYTCKICSYETTHKSRFHIHYLKHSGQYTNINCNFCDKAYRKKQSLDDHILKLHKQEIRGDLNSVITSKIYTCDICNSYETTDKRNFHRHVDLVHNKDQTNMKCEFCTKSFLYKSVLHRHTLRKHKDKIKDNMTYNFLVCKICNSFETTNQMNLDNHVRYAHNDAKTKTKIKCQFCTESFSGKRSLDGHILKQHEDQVQGDVKSFITSNVFSCKMCSFESTFRGVLEKHVDMIHNKTLKFKCEFCQELFLFKYKLEDHMLQEHKDKIKGKMKNFITSQLHKCRICNAFQTRKRVHLKLHMDSNCGLSDKELCQKEKMKKEIYICDICGYRTNRKQRLISHFNTGHNRERLHIRNDT